MEPKSVEEHKESEGNLPFIKGLAANNYFEMLEPCDVCL